MEPFLAPLAPFLLLLRLLLCFGTPLQARNTHHNACRKGQHPKSLKTKALLAIVTPITALRDSGHRPLLPVLG